MKSGLSVIFVAFALLILSSCSTTRVLKEDQYRLERNRIEITNDKKFNPGQLNKYLKQNESLGWSPFLYVYNWANGKNGPWDRFVQRIGKAPVIYNPELVETSVENIENHLEYIGYYGSRVNAEIRSNGKKINVKYNVTLGKRFPIKEINLTFRSTESLHRPSLQTQPDSQSRKAISLQKAALRQKPPGQAAS